LKESTVELQLSGLIGTASHPDMYKIWITGYFFENGLHWQYEGEKISNNCCCRQYLMLGTRANHSKRK